MASINTQVIEAEETENDEEIGENDEREPPEPIYKGKPRGRPPKPIPSDDIWQLIANRPDAKWDITTAHLYRCGPNLDLTRGGQDNKYIKKYTSRFDQDLIKTENGSGLYRMDLNERPAGGANKALGRFYFEIYDAAYPPKIPKGSWMDDSRNEKWAALMPKNEPPAPPPAADKSDNSQWAMRELITELRSNRKQEPEKDKTLAQIKEIAEVFKPQAKEDNTLAAIAALATALRPPPQPAPPPPDNTAMTLLMDQLAAARVEASESRKEAAAAQQRSHDSMLAMLNKKQETTNPLESVKTIIEAMVLMREAGGSGGAGGLTGGIIEGVKELISPWSSAMAPVAATAIQISMQQKANEAMMKARAAQPIQQQPNPAQVPPTQAQVTQPETQPIPPADATAELPPDQQQFLVLVRKCADALSVGLTGDMFAEQLIKLYGELQYDQMMQLPKEQLIGMLKSFPAAWEMLAPYESRLDAFIGEFYAYNEPDSEEVHEAELVSESPKPTKKNKKVVQ